MATTLLPFGESTFPKGVHHPPGLGQGPGQGDHLVADGSTLGGFTGGGYALDTAHDPPTAAGGAAGGTPNVSNGRILSPAGYSEASLRGRSNMSTGKHTFPKTGTAVTGGSAVTSGRGQGAGLDFPRGGKTISSPGRIALPPGAVTLATPRVKRVRLKVGRVGGRAGRVFILVCFVLPWFFCFFASRYACMFCCLFLVCFLFCFSFRFVLFCCVLVNVCRIDAPLYFLRNT